MKTKTHIGKIRNFNRETMTQVCYFLEWSEAQYCEYLFEQYSLFVEAMFPLMPEKEITAIQYSCLYRGVFNNCAAARESTEFLPFAKDVTEDMMVVNIHGSLETVSLVPIGGEYILDEWKHIHDHRRLIRDDAFVNQFNHVLQLIKIV